MPVDLEELKALAQAATSGRWVFLPMSGTVVQSETSDTLICTVSPGQIVLGHSDGEYIEAACPPVVLALVAELELWRENHRGLAQCTGCAACEA